MPRRAGQGRLHRRRGAPSATASSTTRVAPLRRRAAGARRAPRGARAAAACTTAIDLPVAFLGALYAGIVPVAVNTLLTADDYAYMLRAQPRPRARSSRGALAADAAQGDARERRTRSRHRDRRRARRRAADAGEHRLRCASSRAPQPLADAAPTRADDAASGSIRRARPARQGHGAHARQPVLDGRAVRQGVLGLRESDVVLLGGQAVLRLRARQRADVPAVGRRDDAC